MRTKIDCCDRCEDRKTGCHSKCKEYKDQKKELEMDRAKIRKEKQADDYLAIGIADSNDRLRKRQKKNQGLSGYHHE